jgi:DUF438 domain-containing protein
MSEFLGKHTNSQSQPDGTDINDKASKLKIIIDTLAQGVDPKEVKSQFGDLIRNADAYEVAHLEQSLIRQGMAVEEVLRLCDVHAEVFREGLEQGQEPNQISGHPIHTFKEENKIARTLRTKLLLAGFIGSLSQVEKAVTALKPIIRHYERKENQLFPFLEQKGFDGPSKVMWGKHDEIRQVFRDLQTAISQHQGRQARKLARLLAKKISTMMFMEEKILFPNALRLLTEQDWAQVRMGEHAIGFAWVNPGSGWDPVLAFRSAEQQSQSKSHSQFQTETEARSLTESENLTQHQTPNIPLNVGSLPLDVLDTILRTLPIDISFVDHEDKVLYYSDSPHRVFPRSPAIIGRDVHNCHPQKSLDAVEQILRSFKNKEKDRADFWIQMGPKFVVISYKPIYDSNGTYRGTLEMSWDASEVRALEGEKRLL